MPTIMSVGREKYSCRSVFHPTETCGAYIKGQTIRKTINAFKITFFASFIPQVIRQKKKLFQSDLKTALKTMRQILFAWLRAAAFLVLGTAGPFATVCMVPICSDPMTFLPFGVRVAIVYSGWPVFLGLLCE